MPFCTHALCVFHATCVTHFARTLADKFPACKRKNKKFPTCAHTQFSEIRLCQCWWNWKIRCSYTLSVNKAVLFYGVRMFGDSRRSQYEVNFKIKENVTAIYTSQQGGDGKLGYVVMLTKPISLLPDEEFTITATINDEIPAGVQQENDQ